MPHREHMATIAMQHDDVRGKHFEVPALIGIAVVGGAIAFGIIGLGGLPENGTRRFGSAFRHSGEFRMWVFLLVVQTAMWAIGAALLLSPEMRRPLRHVWADARLPVFASVAATAVPLVTFVTVVSLKSNLHYPLRWHREKVLALSLIGIGVALIGIAELALVRFALERAPTGGTAKDIEHYLTLRTLLQRVLGVEGAIVGAAVLSAGALRNAVVAYNQIHTKYESVPDPSKFPREFVLIYGAFFTLLLAMLYVPVYFRLLDVGRENVKNACEDADPRSEAWLAAYEKRKKLEEYLQLEVTTSAGFRSGVAILTPLASALVALLLGAA
jgi:hypothetical protein